MTAQGSQVSQDTRDRREGNMRRGKSTEPEAVKMVRIILEPLGLGQPDDVAPPVYTDEVRTGGDLHEDTPATAERVLEQEKLGGTPRGAPDDHA